MKTKIFISLTLCFLKFSFAQTPSTNAVGTPSVTVQPKIMVIPYTKEGEDIRTILEDDISRRVAVTKIKEAFDDRGFTTVDFVQKLNAAKDNNIFTSDNQSDIKSQIIQMSGADIYIEAEVNVQKDEAGTSATVILTGYESSTGNSLSNKVGESGKYYTDDTDKLVTKAVGGITDNFLDVMQSKFTNIVINGKSVVVDISFDAQSSKTMSSVIDTTGLPLSDLLEAWMGKNAFKNNYHIQGTTDLRMIFDDVRIPLKDPTTGNNYNPNKFALELFKYLRSLNLEAKKEIKSNTIYLTIK